MKTIVELALIAACLVPFSANAFNSHNGISFDMTQQEVEKKGFVCNPLEKKDPYAKATCEHMELTGVAFGYPTKDYSLVIGPSGKVDVISAGFSVHLGMPDYLSLHSKIMHFFPKKDEKASFHEQGVASRDQWRSKDNAAAALLLINGIPPITKTSLSITFFSPRRMAISDKKNK